MFKYYEYLALHNLHTMLMSFSGKNFLRPGQMNINVATWGRLMKRAMPQACSDQPNTISPPTCLIAPGKYNLTILMFFVQ